MRRPGCAHRVGEFLAGRRGLAADLPAGFTVFCARIALMMSVTVTFSFASWSGFTHRRIAYWPAPKTFTFEMPGTRVS